MTVATRKYNPGFLSDDALVATFCVRTREFTSLIEVLRTCSGNANAHQIVIGPRGSGKTSLLLRVAAEIRRSSDLSSCFFPIVFAEESYEVSSAGEFWLECLSRLADQTTNGKGNPDLHRAREELRAIRDDRLLGDRCLGRLQEFSDREGKRLVLIVENLNMMFRDIGDDEAGWRIRQTLQTDPRIILLASATSRFAEIDDPNKALFDQFRVLHLRPLNAEDCSVLWKTVSGQDREQRTIQALRILTGGSPRLLTILARFGAELSFRALMADLLDLVDDHTEYFKSHLDALPHQERRVYLALAELWKPANTREIAERARLDTNKCSAQLARLAERGAVEVVGGSARRKTYYLTERLYNIYYLMRRARGPTPLIEALIRFMEAYYSADQMRELGTQLVQEASAVESSKYTIFLSAFESLLRSPSPKTHRDELTALARATIANASEDTLEANAAPTVAEELSRKALELAECDRLEEALADWNDVIRRFGVSDALADLEQVSVAMVNKGKALDLLGRSDDALQVLGEVVRRFGAGDREETAPAVAAALVSKGGILVRSERNTEALAAFSEVVRRFGASGGKGTAQALAAALVGNAISLNALMRSDEALTNSNEVLDRFDRNDTLIFAAEVSAALAAKGHSLLILNQPNKAMDAFDEVIRRFGSNDSPQIVGNVAAALANKVLALSLSDQLEESLATCGEVLRRFEDSDCPNVLGSIARTLVIKGYILDCHDRSAEAEAVWVEVVQRFGASDQAICRSATEVALYNVAKRKLACGRAKTAIEFLDRLILREKDGVTETRIKAHMLRARARFVEEDIGDSAEDIQVVLLALPELETLPRQLVEDLWDHAMKVGVEPTCKLIKASPAADLLLPLTTALEREIGLEPRMAKEVEEIAEDIREAMHAKNNGRNGREAT